MITPNVIEREWVQGCNVHVENLTGTAFSGENGAHTFKIRGVDADGQPVAISGTVLAKILRADNVTVDVDGSVVDGVAEVTMVGDCYHVPGRASIVIFLSDGTNTVTLYAAVFNVYRSTSGNEIDSGVSIPSLAELLAKIEEMETATAAAEAVVDEYDTKVAEQDGKIDAIETNDAVQDGKIASIENMTPITVAYSYGNNNTFVYYDRINTSSSNISRVVSWVDVSQYSAIYYSRRKNTNSGSNAGMHFADENNAYISGQRDIVGAEENGYEMTWLPVPEGATKARFTAFNDVEAYGDFVLYGVSKLVATVTDIAENDPVQDTAIAANTAAITALESNKADKADLAYTDGKLDVLWKLTHGVAWDTVADNADGYSKAVPQGVHMTEVGMWGGKSIAWNNLVPDSYPQDTSAGGITITKNQDRTFTLNGTATNSTGRFGCGVKNKQQHKYYLRGYIYNDDGTLNNKCYASSQNYGSDYNHTGVIITNQGSNSTWYYVIHVTKDTVLDNVKMRLTVIDLTQMYGAGSEPSTTSDPRIAAIEAYAALHPEYNGGEIVSADVNAIITKKADTTTMQTINIPSAVLTQYPLRSAGNVYDTISFDGSKWWHTKRIGEVDLGTLNWSYNATQRVFASAKINGIREHSSNDATSNWLCKKYITSSLNGIRADYEGTLDKAMGQGFQSGIGNNSQCIRDDTYTDATAFKTAMDGVMLQYELATPIVTDITDLMGGWHGELPTEAGGTITFAQNGDTIFPVPNHLTHYRNLSEVN